MQISPTYLSAIIVVLASMFQIFKINIGSEELTPIIEGLVAGIGGIIILVRRYQKGDIKISGVRK